MTDLRLTPGGLMSDAGGLESWRLTAWWGGVLTPDAWRPGGLRPTPTGWRSGALRRGGGGVLALDAGRGGGLMSEADGLAPTVWRDGALAPYGVVGVASWHSTPGGVSA
ncbi:hypothetical protein OG895_15585 [Streptomyces sp. NBC_00201]|uniref:hypothetical protein n=1 Tax=Streptomyces sp. NBC_00201 TaxID=2975679 RepID=UPI0022551BCD|nr:hypothetical protein [Streptomyces sp. NBC_00201]MCX5246641.1 hypothetical protein [Streptomyces sp. NBC_00201]